MGFYFFTYVITNPPESSLVKGGLFIPLYKKNDPLPSGEGLLGKVFPPRLKIFNTY